MTTRGHHGLLMAGGGGGVAYRYYRILCTANNGHPNYLAICEVEYRATHGGADLTSPSSAAAGAATASDVETASGWAGSIKCAFDNVIIYTGPGTAQWLSNNTPPSVGSPKWLKYDFGTPTVVTEMALIGSHTADSNPSQTAPKDFKVQGSNDNSSWTDLISPSSQTGWTPGQQRIFGW